MIRRTLIALSTLIVACGAEGPPPLPVAPTAARSSTTVPGSCDVARAHLGAASAALAEGRLQRALARLARIADTCSETRDEAASLRARITSTLQTPGDDAAGAAPARDQTDAYLRAARAYVDGRLDDAEKGALAAALAKGELTSEAAILAARLAQAKGDQPRARRWFARAHHALRDGAELRPRAPQADLFAWAAAHEGFRSAGRSCVEVAQREPPGSALSPDGRVAAFTTPTGVAWRVVPSRVLLHRVSLGPSRVVCFDDAARSVAVDSGDRSMLLGPLEGPWRKTEAPYPSHLLSNGVVGRDGSVLFPSFDARAERDHWYRAAPGDRRARRIPFPTPWMRPLLLADGSMVGLEGKLDGPMTMARFDASSGKRRESITKTDIDGDLVETSDGSRIVVARGEHLIVVEPATGRASRFARSPHAVVVGVAGSRVFSVNDAPPSAQAQDLGSGALAWAGIVDRFTTSARGGSRVVVALPEDVLAVDLARGTLTRYPLLAGAPDPQRPLDLAPPALSDDGAWLVYGDARRTSVYDVRDPARPVEVKRYGRGAHDAAFVPGAGVVHIRMQARAASVAYDVSRGAELPFDGKVIDEREARIRAQIESLGRLPARGEPCGFDEASDTVAVCSRDAIGVVRRVEGRLEAVHLTFPFGRQGAMVIDDQGFFDFVGDVPDAFRAAAACGDELPIEVCADRLEAPGMLARFLRGDLGYREP